MNPFSRIRTVTVSGIRPKIGKTLLACYVVSVLQNVCAIKIIMHTGETAVISDDASLMIDGKDTFRLKQSGAQKVVMIKTDENGLANAFLRATALTGQCKNLVIEGNSILRHFSPDVAVVVCDETIQDISKIKASRVEALAKADIILFNPFSDDLELIRFSEERCKQINSRADYIRLTLTEREKTETFLKTYLREKGFLTG